MHQSWKQWYINFAESASVFLNEPVSRTPVVTFPQHTDCAGHLIKTRIRGCKLKIRKACACAMHTSPGATMRMLCNRRKSGSPYLGRLEEGLIILSVASRLHRMPLRSSPFLLDPLLGHHPQWRYLVGVTHERFRDQAANGDNVGALFGFDRQATDQNDKQLRWNVGTVETAPNTHKTPRGHIQPRRIFTSFLRLLHKRQRIFLVWPNSSFFANTKDLARS